MNIENTLPQLISQMFVVCLSFCCVLLCWAHGKHRILSCASFLPCVSCLSTRQSVCLLCAWVLCAVLYWWHKAKKGLCCVPDFRHTAKLAISCSECKGIPIIFNALCGWHAWRLMLDCASRWNNKNRTRDSTCFNFCISFGLVNGLYIVGSSSSIVHPIHISWHIMWCISFRTTLLVQCSPNYLSNLNLYKVTKMNNARTLLIITNNTSKFKKTWKIQIISWWLYIYIYFSWLHSIHSCPPAIFVVRVGLA